MCVTSLSEGLFYAVMGVCVCVCSCVSVYFEADTFSFDMLFLGNMKSHLPIRETL